MCLFGRAYLDILTEKCVSQTPTFIYEDHHLQSEEFSLGKRYCFILATISLLAGSLDDTNGGQLWLVGIDSSIVYTIVYTQLLSCTASVKSR